ncbi:MAG: hypothetical protein RLZZ227_1109 [Pseudomonadota bacterium]|jgi:hypothetical protein
MDDHLAPFRRYFRIAAVGTTIASAILTAIFAWHQGSSWLVSIPLVLGLVMFSIASDYVLLFISDAWKSRRYIFCTFVALGGLVVFTINLVSNVGSVGWQRESVVSAAKVQNTRHDDGRDTVTDFAKRAASFEDRAKQLDQEMAALVTSKVAGWTVATRPASPEELDGQIAAKQLEVDNEAKRKGCGAKCEARTNELAHLKALRAKAVEIAKNNEMHAAALQGLANARNASSTQTRAVAAPASQAMFFASLFNASLDPTEASQTWTDRGIATWLALGLCIAPMLFGMLGWRSDDIPNHPTHHIAGNSYPAPRPAQDGPATAPQSNPTTLVIRDEVIRKWAQREDVKGMLKAA